MKNLTIIVAMSGHGGHGLARTIAENNPEYRWYDHPKNNIDHPDHFPELDLAKNHFRKRFADNSVFPHLFDRIDEFLKEDSVDNYYDLAKSEINTLSQGKKLIYVCHETPKNIKIKFPEANVIQILPTENILENVIERHMNTHMEYPIQSKLHKLPMRDAMLNELYWSMRDWARDNKNASLKNFRAYYLNKTVEEVIFEERETQRKLYKEQLESTKYADNSLIEENKLTAFENFNG